MEVKVNNETNMPLIITIIKPDEKSFTFDKSGNIIKEEHISNGFEIIISHPKND